MALRQAKNMSAFDAEDIVPDSKTPESRTGARERERLQICILIKVVHKRFRDNGKWGNRIRRTERGKREK